MNTQQDKRNLSIILYLISGFAFGSIFVIVGSITEAVSQGFKLNLENVITVNSQTPLLWIIDTAPLVLGLMAAIIGNRQRNLQMVKTALEEKLSQEERLSSELNELTHQLERRVEERTKDVERRSRYIEAAAEIGRAATSIYKLDELLPRVVDQISAKFGFYQVGIFMIDDQREYAVMRAASSEGGKRMLARNHKLKVAEQGIVGYVTSTGLARVALDVGEDAVFFNTPELPNTSSEMALPLFYGGRLIGALDVQSDRQDAFSEQDISALNVLADQVSMAINNALLFEELQSSLDAERRAFSQISREAWRDYFRQAGSIGFRYTNDRVVQTDPQWPEDMIQALETKQIIKPDVEKPTLSIPILASGEPIGVIRVSKDAGKFQWSDEETELVQTLTDRISQAVESARLFQATQQQAAQDQLSSEISTKFRQTLDIDTVLKTAAKELGSAFNAREVVIRMASNDSDD